jgi:hypothetical protein
VPRHVAVSPDATARRAFVLVTSSPSRPDRLVSGSPGAAIARHGFVVRRIVSRLLQPIGCLPDHLQRLDIPPSEREPGVNFFSDLCHL